MNIADRIQYLRKSKGISQEELADKIGVFRQSVSKWESEQTSPDIDKIILMSELFDVTTDYLLKGIEPAPANEAEKRNRMLFAVTATAINFIGLIVAIALWQGTLVSIGIGSILFVIGCMIYGIGAVISDAEIKAKAKRTFWTINIWVFAFIPCSIMSNLILTGQNHNFAPFPVTPLRGQWSSIFFLLGYIAICGTVTYLLIKNTKK